VELPWATPFSGTSKGPQSTAVEKKKHKTRVKYYFMKNNKIGIRVYSCYFESYSLPFTVKTIIK